MCKFLFSTSGGIIIDTDLVYSLFQAQRRVKEDFEQKTPDLIDQMYTFFKHPDDERKNDSYIFIPGMVRGLAHHQAYAIMWMLTVVRLGFKDKPPMIRGGILGDKPGFGKVRIITKFRGNDTDYRYLVCNNGRGVRLRTMVISRLGRSQIFSGTERR